jgi:hypothetical protein
VTRIQLRSRRDPAVWLPILIVTLVMVALAAWAQSWMSGWMGAVEATADSDPERAIVEATRLIRLCEAALLASSVAFAVFLARFFQLGLREARLPPSGWWSLGAWQAVVGDQAQRMSRLGLGLTLLLLIATAAMVLAIEVLLRAILAGSAAAG